MFTLDNTSKRSSMISSAQKENPKAFECPFETAKDADLAGCSTNLNSRNSDPHTKQDSDQQRKKGLLGNIFQYRQKLNKAEQLLSDHSTKAVKLSSIKGKKPELNNHSSVSNIQSSYLSLNYTHNTSI